MKALWVIRPAVQDSDGAWAPSFPAGFSAAWQNNCDIRILPAGSNPGVDDHKHAISGAIALGSNHGHYVFYSGQVVHQEHFGAGTAHDHADTVDPDFFAVFVVCTDDMYNFLIGELPNLIILGECIVDEETGELGQIAGVAWDATERQTWETLFANFGFTLPEKVTNDRRLMQFILTTFHAPSQKILNERNYRYSSYTIE